MVCKNLAGQKFNRWTVLSNEIIRSPNPKNKNTSRMCKCDCGTIKAVKVGDLKSGKSPSCGCIRSSQNNLTKHPLHKKWAEMNRRCYNPKHSSYSRYGGKGVIVCKRWRKGQPNALQNFIKDLEAEYNIAVKKWGKSKVHLDKDIKGTGFIYNKHTVMFAKELDNCTEGGRKLTPKEVKYIRTSSQINRVLADELNVCKETIRRVKARISFSEE